MFLRSTLSTIFFRFVIAFFVQERIFVYGNECLCKCNTNDVCDELKRLATNDDTKAGELEKWKIYIPFLKTLHQNFDLELWIERLRKIENKINSTEDLKGKLKETESHVTRLEDALENVKKEFEINVSTINERMHVVENQMKLFLPVIEAEKRTGDQLKINISTIESRMNVLENQIKNFELVTEEEKRNRKELEEDMEIHREFMSNFERNDMKFQIITSEMEQRLSNVENEVENFTVSMKAEKKAREDLEEEMLRNTSKRFSNVYKQYRNLKNDFDTKLLNVIEDTKLLKSDVEKEKSARKNYSEENMKTYRNITSIIESKDKKFQTAISEAEQRLSNVKNEVEKLKASIKAEKEVRQELEEEMLRNTSKRFSNVNKQYRNLKNDFDRKLLNVIEDTKLLKSDVEKEKSARKNYSEENMKRYRNITSIIIMNELKFQFDMMNADQRLFNLENKVEISETSIKAEKKARQELEENMKTQWNVMSIVESRNMKFETAISKAEQRLSNVENEVENFKASIKAEKEAREELEVKLRTNFSTTSRLNNEEHSEIRKNLTSIERELSNLQRIISLKDTSFNKLEGKVKDISAKMPLLISDIAEEKAAREDIVRKIQHLHPIKSLFL